MNADQHAALRTEVKAGFYDPIGFVVTALLDEIAELRCGLGRARDGNEGHPYDIVVGTLARADAIGGGE